MQCLTIAVKMCQGTFIKENIQEKLGAVRRADITVKTLNGEQSMKSIAGLRVSSSTAGDKEIWLNPPPVYTRKNIPVDIEEVLEVGII